MKFVYLKDLFHVYFAYLEYLYVKSMFKKG
jgi:hypothetical protein